VPNPIVLTGASVVITGAARGIGYATARAFVAEGARVFIGDLDGELAKAAADELGCTGARVDVRSRESLTEFLAGVEPPVQVLVNNAGIMPAGRFADESDAVTDAIVDVNLNGVCGRPNWCCREWCSAVADTSSTWRPTWARCRPPGWPLTAPASTLWWGSARRCATNSTGPV
jgi:NAD(P)-dependent dehydrogenase (short-subunit alcohol dehydrogenase family)